VVVNKHTLFKEINVVTVTDEKVPGKKKGKE